MAFAHCTGLCFKNNLDIIVSTKLFNIRFYTRLDPLIICMHFHAKPAKLVMQKKIWKPFVMNLMKKIKRMKLKKLNTPTQN